MVASTNGNTAVKAVEVFEGLKVVVVTHSEGHREPDTQEFTEESRKMVESNGGIILTTAHTFLGMSRALRERHNMTGVPEIIADVLRCFGAGTKVSCEIAIMATDSGLVSTTEDVIAIGGTHSGADTALVFTPVNAQRFFNLRVKEILCKPHSPPGSRPQGPPRQR